MSGTTPANKLYVQYGCGTFTPQGWLNFDCSPTLRLQLLLLLGAGFRSVSSVMFPPAVRYGDIVRGLPLTDGSATAVYCSHVLEHLSPDNFRTVLRNTFRILRPGGTFRMVLPDLRFMAAKHIGDQAPDAAPAFMRDTMLGVEKRPRGFADFLRARLRNSWHTWPWDYPSLAHKLAEAGSVNPRPATFNGSSAEMFRAVESESHWQDALGIEYYRS